MKNLQHYLMVATLMLAAVVGTLAVASEDKALTILRAQEAADAGFNDAKVVGTMILRNKSGKESVRKFVSVVLEEQSGMGGDMSIVTFQSPKDIKGTSLLSHSNSEPKDDYQWLFLPALKRVKRISSSNRAGKFVASEFSYEDLGAPNIDDSTHIWLAQKKCPTNATLTCAVIESKPKNKKSGYSRTIQYIDLKEYRTFQVDFYNRRGDLEKILVSSDFKRYQSKFWRAHKMEMNNLKSFKSTTLVWSDYQFEKGLKKKSFNPQTYYE